MEKELTTEIEPLRNFFSGVMALIFVAKNVMIIFIWSQKKIIKIAKQL